QNQNMNENDKSNISNSELILQEILKNCLQINEEVTPINWETISRLIPHTTPCECEAKFKIMKSKYTKQHLTNNDFNVKKQFPGTSESTSHAGGVYEYLCASLSSEMKENRASGSSKQYKPSQHDRNAPEVERFLDSTPDPVISKDQGPSMVIHVCDEAKNLKQDFNCPRDLLVQEMQYFAEYLSFESQRLEEVDISVHCDIHIFDWLMRYVKRGTSLIEEYELPKLEPSNVISILISSDFLKMDSLVKECVNYCQENMSAIVATPCNMNCVNDRLTSQIAAKFSHSELEDVKDRKDKFKSKLFCKKIEKLFDPNVKDEDSVGKACYLFKCSVCERVMTKQQSPYMACSNNRLTVDKHGGMTFKHSPDLSWDINAYLVSLYDELRKWNLVYWRLWGLVNHLKCSRCSQTFQLCEFGHCRYHTERAQFQNLAGDGSDYPIGVYLCCNQTVLRFDPTGLNKGCHVRDHVVTTTDSNHRKCLDDMLSHKALIKIPYKPNDSNTDLNIFSAEETQCSIKETTSTPLSISTPAPVQLSPTTSKTFQSSLQGAPDSTEEDTIDDETMMKQMFVAPQKSVMMSQLPSVPRSQSYSAGSIVEKLAPKRKEKIQIPTDITAYAKFPSKQKWDTARSIRWNQDTQREEDRRRFHTMASQLPKQRSGEKSEKTKTKDLRGLPGGIFTKLE
uniref:SANT and BTB domain-containing protein n=1 Tax=Ciona intestinalis TaxID=7719 RepID=F7BEE9_CIOIN